MKQSVFYPISIFATIFLMAMSCSKKPVEIEESSAVKKFYSGGI